MYKYRSVKCPPGGRQVGSTESEGPMENPQSEILTIDETAALLKIPRSSVYRLAQQGKFQPKRLAGIGAFTGGRLLTGLLAR